MCKVFKQDLRLFVSVVAFHVLLCQEKNQCYLDKCRTYCNDIFFSALYCSSTIVLILKKLLLLNILRQDHSKFEAKYQKNPAVKGIKLWWICILQVLLSKLFFMQNQCTDFLLSSTMDGLFPSIIYTSLSLTLSWLSRYLI